MRCFAITLLLSVLLCACGNKSEIPDFNILLTDSATVFNTAKVPVGKPIVFIFFGADCEHCQEQTNELLKNIDALNMVMFYFVSIDPIDKIKIFQEHYKLERYPNILIGRDYAFSFPKFFEVNTTPFTAIYDKHQKLKVIIKGEAEVSKIETEIKAL